MQDYYIKTLVRYLVDQFYIAIQAAVTSYQSRSTTYLILYIVLLFGIYILFWIPILNNLSD